ncbi:MAG: hypothetical protein R3309_09330 [Reinekea sp.]|nr:hypothetical protein [Reinekea sp.]
MYRKISVGDEELLFTHRHQEAFQKSDSVLLDTRLKAEQHIADAQHRFIKTGVYGLMLTTSQHLIETRTLLNVPSSLKALTTGRLLKHIIQANATRLILVCSNPAGELNLPEAQRQEASRIKYTLLEFSLWLDDVFIVNKPTGKPDRMKLTSLASMGVI